MLDKFLSNFKDQTEMVPQLNLKWDEASDKLEQKRIEWNTISKALTDIEKKRKKY